MSAPWVLPQDALTETHYALGSDKGRIYYAYANGMWYYYDREFETWEKSWDMNRPNPYKLLIKLEK